MIQKLDFTISLHEPIQGIKQALKVIRPEWLDSVAIKEIEGGLMNKLMKCIYNENEILLIKIYGNQSEIYMDREKEQKIHKYLSEIGLSVPLIASFQNGIIYEYTPGRPLTSSELFMPPIRTKIAQMLAKFHRCHPKNVKCQPGLWEKFNMNVGQIPDNFNEDIKKNHLGELLKKSDILNEIEWLREVIDGLNEPLVLSHNDLFERNIIYDEKTDKLSFIDFEISDYNYQGYDFGFFFTIKVDNHNSDGILKCASDEQIRIFLCEYLEFLDDGDKRPERVEYLLHHTKYFFLTAFLMDIAWAMQQIHISVIDFDYKRHVQLNWNSYCAVKKTLFPSLSI